MSRIVEGLTVGDVVQVATDVDRTHQAGHTCQVCSGDGCAQVTWAADILTQWNADPVALRQRIATW